MICKPCQMAADFNKGVRPIDGYMAHQCLGKSHCDCQHKVGPSHKFIQENKAKTNGNEEN